MSADGLVLPVPFIRQPDTQLCWATCCSMVLRANGKRIDPCAIAAQVFGEAGCPNEPALPEDGYYPYDVPFEGPLEGYFGMDTIVDEITVWRRPVEVYIQYDDPAPGGAPAHVVLIIGVYQGDAVLVHDPLSDRPLWCTHEELVQGFGLGPWTHTYHRIGGALGHAPLTS
ncbi:papain-like cysteine protease family protein [Pararoseomonas sp. SCSIO 73927]|uniref:C39 family peptidase n=1 Tax=Pararoseomonas sp. SCSIO 73927 TaxID=3114537 RepID=UPI0030CEF417